MDTLLFGAYFKIETTQYVANWDQTQINMQVTGLADTTIGGSVGNFPPTLFSWTGNQWETDWFLVSGSVDLTSLSSFPASATININLQNGALSPTTTLWIDSAYAGAACEPVPEPATMLLFGTGLLGLAGATIRRRKK